MAGPVSLTPSEEALLSLVDAGMVDAEIAVRLGLGIGEVQRRVESLTRKFGLPDRTALRDARDGSNAEQRAAPADDDGIEPERPPGRARPILTRVATLGAVSVVAVALLAFILHTEGGANPPPTGDLAATPDGASASPTPAATVTPTPVHIGGVLARAVTVGDGDAPDGGDRTFDLFDASILVTTQCRICPGSEQRLVRVTRPANLPSDSHLEPITVPAWGEPSSLRAVASDQWGWRIAATLCVDASPVDCRFQPRAAGSSALLLSEDGGVTWRELGRYAGTVLPESIGAEGILTLRFSSADDGSETLKYTFVVPAGPDIEVPMAAQETFRPIGLLPDGRTAWTDATRDYWGVVFDWRGDIVLTIPVTARVNSIVPVTSTTLVAGLDTGIDDLRAVVVAIAPSTVGTVTDAFVRFPFLRASSLAYGESNACLVSADQLGVAPAHRFLPAFERPGPWTPVGIFCVSSGRLYELRNFFAFNELDLMAITVQGVRRGPHTRVVGPPSGDCAAVYERPDPQSAVVACFAAGVLLWDAGYDPATLLRHDVVRGSNVWVPVAWPGVPTALTTPHAKGWMLASSLNPEVARPPEDKR